MDCQRAVGRCETVARYSQLASEFLPGSKNVCMGRRQIPLSVQSACADFGKSAVSADVVIEETHMN